MRKNIYEIFDEFALAEGEVAKAGVLHKHNSDTLQGVLKLAYSPAFQFYIKSMPIGYNVAEDIPGLGYGTLSQELRRLYMFCIGNPTADNLDPRRREQLFINLCESLEPKEVDVILGIVKKDLGVPGLDAEFIKRVFPDLL